MNDNGAGDRRFDPARYRGAAWTTGHDLRDGAFELARSGEDALRTLDMPGSDGSGARTTIDELVQALVIAWNRHDATAFAAAFAEDVEFTNVFGLTLSGRAAIEASHAAIFQTTFKDSTLTATGTHVRFVRADVAAVDVRWELTGGRDPEGNAWPKRHSLMAMVATEQAGAWSVTVCHNQDLPPPGPVAAVAALWTGHGHEGLRCPGPLAPESTSVRRAVRPSLPG